MGSVVSVVMACLINLASSKNQFLDLTAKVDRWEKLHDGP